MCCSESFSNSLQNWRLEIQIFYLKILSTIFLSSSNCLGDAKAALETNYEKEFRTELAQDFCKVSHSTGDTPGFQYIISDFTASHQSNCRIHQSLSFAQKRSN